MSEITEAATRVLRVIIELTERDGIPPSYRDIGNHLEPHISVRAVNDHVDYLIRANRIAKVISPDGKMRGLAILANPDGTPYYPPAVREMFERCLEAARKAPKQATRDDIVARLRALMPGK